MTAPSLEGLENAEVVVGLVPAALDSPGIEGAIGKILQAALPASTVLVHPPCEAIPCEPPQSTTQWRFLTDPRLRQDRAALAQSFGQSFRAIFDIAEKLGAKACAVITSDLSTVNAKWVELLVNPVFEKGFDLAAPCYARDPLDGIVNRAIVYPMVRALYGRRVRNPMGPDFGLSARMLSRMSLTVRPRLHPLVSLVPEALANNLKICQVILGARAYPLPDWSNLTPIVSQVAGALFLDVERFAPFWQRARGSQPIPEFGAREPEEPHAATVDTAALIEGFRTGARTLVPFWGTILPPSTLVDLGVLARLPSASFRMKDGVWSRIVYDFAVAHRFRPVERERILRALTPLFMAWTASYAAEIANAPHDAVEQRIEELSACFESTKPYFLSRWRWPDRFNP